jgi:hypothetical protein
MGVSEEKERCKKRKSEERDCEDTETARRKTAKGEIHGKASELDLAGRHFYYAPTLPITRTSW